ncbi:hypothetical protein BC830DRAFT_1172132 [Chytriomyces sp. MP71]|nr:hypothetical protein BC830DRAFT_1172132 [Chytriomyces sp. MP71]
MSGNGNTAYSVTLQYGSGSCAMGNVAAVHYQPLSDPSQCTTVNTCTTSNDGPFTVECISLDPSNLIAHTTQLMLGSNIPIATEAVFSDPKCTKITQIFHFRLSACIVTKYPGFNSSMAELSSDGTQLMIHRFSDTACSTTSDYYAFAPTNGACVANPGDETKFVVVSKTVTETPSASSGLSIGVIVAAVFGSALALAALGLGWFWIYRKQQQKDDAEQVESNSNIAVATNSSIRDSNSQRSITLMDLAPGSAVRTTTAFSSSAAFSAWNRNSVITVHGPSGLRNESGDSQNDVKENPLFAGIDEANQHRLSFASANPPQSSAFLSGVDSASLISSSLVSSNYGAFAGASPVEEELVLSKLGLNPARWTVEEAQRWILLNGGDANTKKLVEDNEIDGQSLMTLSPDTLMEILDITVMGRRVKFTNGIERMKVFIGQTLDSGAGGSNVPVPEELAPPAYETMQT